MLARLSKPALGNKLEDAVRLGDGYVRWLSEQGDHPFRFELRRDHRSYAVRAYIWNLTHGGGPARASDEYRIQATGIDRFEPEPDGQTLVLGWWDAEGVFAGFDVRRRLGPLGASPSIQVRRANLLAAKRTGMSDQHKEANGEVVITLTPAFLADYIENLDALHGTAASSREAEALDAVLANPGADTDPLIEEQIAAPRREAVYAVRRKLREASFRERVLAAYGHACAVCGLQLDLVQSAHIIPVAHPDGTDETGNGLALCPLHHHAFDAGLIVVSDDYRVSINRRRAGHLQAIERGMGLDGLVQGLRNTLSLPDLQSQRPRRDYLRRASRIRGSDS